MANHAKTMFRHKINEEALALWLDFETTRMGGELNATREDKSLWFDVKTKGGEQICSFFVNEEGGLELRHGPSDQRWWLSNFLLSSANRAFGSLFLYDDGVGSFFDKTGLKCCSHKEWQKSRGFLSSSLFFLGQKPPADFPKGVDGPWAGAQGFEAFIEKKGKKGTPNILIPFGATGVAPSESLLDAASDEDKRLAAEAAMLFGHTEIARLITNEVLARINMKNLLSYCEKQTDSDDYSADEQKQALKKTFAEMEARVMEGAACEEERRKSPAKKL